MSGYTWSLLGVLIAMMEERLLCLAFFASVFALRLAFGNARPPRRY